MPSCCCWQSAAQRFFIASFDAARLLAFSVSKATANFEFIFRISASFRPFTQMESRDHSTAVRLAFLKLTKLVKSLIFSSFWYQGSLRFPLSSVGSFLRTL